MPPSHHKELANFLKENTEGNPAVSAYRDNNGLRPIPIGQFGGDFYSTIGAFDMGLSLPAGNFEFAASGSNEWLPNSLASSIYWLTEHGCDEWPLICEDVVQDNARSTYRHMAYVPSPFALELSTGQVVKWLLGVPVTDNEVGSSEQELMAKAQQLFPKWLFRASA
jgi:hypothetical protein